MLLAGLVVIGAAVILMNIRTAKLRQQYVEYDRPSLHYSAVQIVCGNCAGDAILANKTFMDRNGYCEKCGGSSYILASEIGLNRRMQRVARLEPVGATATATPRRPDVGQERPKLEPVPQMKIAV